MAENPYDPRFVDYLVYAERYVRENKFQRKGQAYFNALALSYPKLADKIARTHHDPFFEDDRLDEFLAYVKESLLGS